ncbi:MAG: CHRD domain-containing protein [Pseudomonadota bacterium]|nr:CHRD domain-containing protein [Pseudomonadota bacterium]
MPTRRQVTRFSLAAFTTMAAVAITGCGMMQRQAPPAPAPDANLVTLTTQLRASNEVPPVVSQGSGSVDALFNKDNNLLRWRVSYTGLSGPATAAHFHGPAPIGANAGVALPWPGPVSSPMEGRATLTAAQAADLLAGRWYANIHTATHPGGEVRGQMTVRN